jgi:hypothetical protein
MADAKRELMEQLLVVAAGIMEDVSVEILAMDMQDMAERIARLRKAGANLSGLAQAVEVLLSRLPDSSACDIQR